MAAIEQAPQQTDRFARYPVNDVPNADHLTDAQNRQLAYQIDWRAWQARDVTLPRQVVMLAQHRTTAAVDADQKREAAAARSRARGLVRAHGAHRPSGDP